MRPTHHGEGRLPSGPTRVHVHTPSNALTHTHENHAWRVPGHTMAHDQLSTRLPYRLCYTLGPLLHWVGQLCHSSRQAVGSAARSSQVIGCGITLSPCAHLAPCPPVCPLWNQRAGIRFSWYEANSNKNSLSLANRRANGAMGLCSPG